MAESSPAGDRVLSALAGARGRRPEDATDPAVPVAGTIILARDGAEGAEVLLIERPDRGAFAGAWVFPGGKVEPADRTDPAEAEVDVARRAAVREAAEETGLVVAPEDVVTSACWDPPPGLALRIRTWFFAAAASDAPLRLAPAEAVSAEWLPPAVVLHRHARGELTLYPPTWVTLHGLAGLADARSLVAHVRDKGVELFETTVGRDQRGPLMLWHGDAQHESAGGAASAAGRHRLSIGDLPWRYERSGTGRQREGATP